MPSSTPMLPLTSRTQVVIRRHKTRAELDGAIEVVGGILQPAGLIAEHAEAVMKGRIAGFENERLRPCSYFERT